MNLSRDHLLYDPAAVREMVDRVAFSTPVVPSEDLSRRCGAPVSLKLENLQITGSFKVRGATAKILRLTETERARGLIACSSGNHGRAVTYVAQQLGIPVTICVPEWVDPVKRDAMLRSGATVLVTGATYDETEAHAAGLAAADGLTNVSPYDDPDVIAGQGTIGLEILEQVTGVSHVLVPVSGGGLVAGIAVAIKRARPAVRVIGVSAERASVMLASVKAGHPIALPEEPTLATALAGGIGLENRHTFRLVRDLVDEHVTVTEEEIARAMAFLLDRHHTVAEGGGAVTVAAALAERVQLPGPAVLVVSGGNIARETLLETIGRVTDDD